MTSPKSLSPCSPSISLRDKSEDIVERMELARHNYDLLERRKDRNQALSLPFKPDFRIQPTLNKPSYVTSPVQIKVKRKEVKASEAEEGLKALGFEGNLHKRLIRLEKTQIPKLESHSSVKLKGKPPIMRFVDRPRLTKSEMMKEEAAQYLQEEFRQLLTSGYLRKLHPSSSAFGLPGLRGLELI